MLRIYTDGSSRGNPGEGGYGFVVMDDNNNILHYFTKTESLITNNQAELKAILRAIDYTQSHKENTYLIYSDSAYCVNICNNWIFTWAKNDWKNSKKKTIENVNLIKYLYEYLIIDFNNFQVLKTSGHSGVIGNELADALATNNKDKFFNLIKENNITNKTT